MKSFLFFSFLQFTSFFLNDANGQCSGSVNAGVDQTVCANNAAVTLIGSQSGTSSIQWTTTGTGAFLNASSLNTTYNPSPADTAAGMVKLILEGVGTPFPCTVKDTMIVTITPSPIVNAGADQTICGNNSYVQLDGYVTLGMNSRWFGGTGTYTPMPTVINAIYTPTQFERIQGYVILELRSTGNGNCLPVSDYVRINFLPNENVNAGPDQTICANNAYAVLNASGNNISSFTWSGGTGTFSPNENTANATYYPSVSEIAAGTVVLTVTSTGTTCSSISDQMRITISPPPTANAGPDQTICGDTVYLSGSVTIATGGTWTTQGSGWFINQNSLITKYVLTAGDKLMSPFNLTLTTTGNGICNAVQDQMIVTYNNTTQVNAGADQSICLNADATLNGSIGGSATTVTWSGGAGTFSPSNTVLNATYTPTSSERTAGTVYLILTAASSGGCSSKSDYLDITIASCTGSIDPINAEQIIIYPNPANEKLTIDLSNEKEIETIKIYNSAGEKVKEVKVSGEEIFLSTEEMSAGMYVLIFENKNGRRLKRMIIKN